MTPTVSKFENTYRQEQGHSSRSPALSQRRRTPVQELGSSKQFDDHERGPRARQTSELISHIVSVQESMNTAKDLENDPSVKDSRHRQSLQVAASAVISPVQSEQVEEPSASQLGESNTHDPSYNSDKSGSSVDASTNFTVSKRTKGAKTNLKELPVQYETCDVKDLVQLIGEMLLDLIRINDRLPLQEDALTRFHSRVPPGISVMDYLQRLATHASLSPPILLSMVYYIDKLCALYPAFTITSLTVHRYLIASATVASKGLSDTFWTNSTYARVGGVSIKELGLLELELLRRVDWRIVPKPEVLVEYYRSLVDRSEGFALAVNSESNQISNTTVK